MQSFPNYNFRPLKSGEISFALDAYEEMLKEIQHYEESYILPTKRTIDAVANILIHNYKKGNECYCVTDNELIIGYSLVMENDGFDTKYKIFNGLGLYIEPEYRKKGLAQGLIGYTLDKVKEKGAVKFIASFILERPSSEAIMNRFGFQKSLGIACKTF